MNIKFKFVVSIFFLMSAISLSNSVKSKEMKADGIAAVVGSHIILVSEVDLRVTELIAQLEQMKQPAMSFEKAQKTALNDIINEQLVYVQAKEMELSVSDDEVDSAIENMAVQNGMSSTDFEKAISSQGMDIGTYKKSIRKDLLKYKVMNLRVRGRVNISVDQARDFYNNQVRDVRQSAWFQGGHILLRIPKGARAIDVANLRKKAVDIIAEIKSGLSFENAAKEYSQDDATAPYGGHLGKRMPGDIPRILDSAFLNMERDEIAGPLRTSAGFHIIKLFDREDTGVKPFSEVQNIIISQLTQKEMERQQEIWLKELRRKIFISIRI
ncbi:MAG: peptidylprolyl isomerase [Deltaproteobacteria bacterium]|nr:peptidylprolyl isomerase [Deltaproteobacteria bacterium]